MPEVFAEHLVQFVDLGQLARSPTESQNFPRIESWQKVAGDVGSIVTPGENDSAFCPWSESMSKQCGGYVQVPLEATGMNKRAYPATMAGDSQQAQVGVSAVCMILGAHPGDLSAEHPLRLDQCKQERGAQGE